MSFSLFRSENKPEVEQDSTPTALSEADGSVELVSPPKKQLPLLSLARELAFSNIQVVTSNPKQSVMIPYRSMPFDDFRRHMATLPERQQLTMAMPGLIAAATLLLCSLAVFMMPGADKTLIIGLALLNTPICMSLCLMFLAHDRIISDQFGLSVQNSGYPYYWNDMEHLSIVDRPRNGKHRFYVRIDCRSGRALMIRISHLYPESIEPLTMEIEKHAPFCRNVSQLAELKRFRDFERGELPGVTYTQLFEGLTNKNIELTGFAPLQRGHSLQDGRLKVLHQIASGGFSAVYLVENDEGTKYVLKESILPFGVDEELAQKAAEQFEREARILKTLHHPQIACVYDFFVEQGRKYMLLEYLAGATLKQTVYESGPLPPEKVLSYAIQICSLLDYLHKLPTPLVHRDVAPDNLVLSAQGKISLIDFGSANEFVGNATGTLVGKHAYMAPEQIRGKATPQSDIYSLGQTLFYCVEGGAPSPLKSSRLSKSDTMLTKHLDGVIHACTQLDAAQRPDSMSAVIAMLEEAFSSSGRSSVA